MKNVMLWRLVVLFSAITMCGLICTGEDDELTLEPRPYDGSDLRIDGYYYRFFDAGLIQVYFFYRNGVILHGGDFKAEKLSEKEEMYRNGQFYNITQNSRKYLIFMLLSLY